MLKILSHGTVRFSNYIDRDGKLDGSRIDVHDLLGGSNLVRAYLARPGIPQTPTKPRFGYPTMDAAQRVEASRKS